MRFVEINFVAKKKRNKEDKILKRLSLHVKLKIFGLMNE